MASPASPTNAKSHTEKKGLVERFEEKLQMFPFPVRFAVNSVIILFLLWLFLVGLSLMGNAFKGLSGRGAAQLLGSVTNPVAGLAFGVLGTVLFQSSSTSTSVVVTMVAADILSVRNAIPIIMGANIGTSVTSSIVSHVHITDKDEFKRGFQGASVHSAFNFLTVLCIFPVEVATNFLGISSGFIAEMVLGANLKKWDSPTKMVTKPVTKHVIGINKDLIKEIAKGCTPCEKTDDGLCMNDVKDGDSYTRGTMECDPSFCHDVKKVDDEKFHFCISEDEWTRRHMEEERVVNKGFASDMGDVVGSTVVLVIALFLLCFALYWIVRVLHYLVLSSGRRTGENGEQTTFMRLTQKVLGMHPILSIIYGTLLTVAVQSSSITTSIMTPLVALDIITLEQVLPLTLGANIGTTCTAFIASVVSGSADAIQVSICHLLFNLLGIAIWFPLPFMRAVPLRWARLMGDYVVLFPWFGVLYIAVAFVALPLALYLSSLLLNYGTFGLIANCVLNVLLVGGTMGLMTNFPKMYSIVTGRPVPEAPSTAQEIGKSDVENQDEDFAPMAL
jgi:sodium-dependent phosphate cotransporter